MGFSTVFTSLASGMVYEAAGFITDFMPVFQILVGIAMAGYALLVLRRFIG